MKKLIVSSLLVTILTCLTLVAQQAPPAGQGGARGGGGRGGRGAAPPATGPVADATNRIIDAINKQDGAFFDKALTADAILSDEDGHLGLPARAWATRLTAMPKKIAIANLRVGDLGADGAWAVFTYTLDETTAQGAANQMKGSSTIVYKKTGADLQAAVIQISVNGVAITPH